MRATDRTKKDEILKEAKGALIYLKKVYEDFDLMNGHLHELSEVLDNEEFEWFHDFWSKFPTYNELDDLDDFLTNTLPKALEKEVDENE